MRTNPYLAQPGFSLIELMIASALSLVLVAGVATVYMSSRQTYNTRDEMSAMQENARNAINALTKHLEHAGYSTPRHLPLDNAFYVDGDPTPVAKNCGGGANSIALADPNDLRHTLDDDTPAGTGDTIGVVFFADDSLANDCGSVATPASCQAQEAPNPEYSRVYNTFYIATPTDEAVPNLFCAGSRGTQPIAVAEGVEAMQFAYGLDEDGNGTVDTYLDATSVSTANRWSEVRAIKAALLMRSREPAFDVAESKDYTLLGTTFNRNDRYQHTVHTAVIYLRNLAVNQGA
ncbi:MAG TPA: PilW family protein [Thiolinea sp.]|nr:PilW family protein [Thiolinea sp.]